MVRVTLTQDEVHNDNGLPTIFDGWIGVFDRRREYFEINDDFELLRKLVVRALCQKNTLGLH